MSRIESGFIPLPKVEQEQPEENVEIRLNLPSYVDQDRIGVNLTNIRKLSDWGGIRRVRIVGKTDQDTSVDIPEIVGINSDGSASAGKKIAKVDVPTFESYSSDYGWFNYQIANRWKNVGINLNINEITQRVKEKPEGVREASSWAKLLDGSIKEPIRAEGHQNLLHDLERGDKFNLYNIATLGTVISAVYSVSEGKPILGAYFGAYCGVTITSIVRAVAQRDFRFSFIPGYQVDRAAILSVTSRIKKVIKDIGEKSN